MATLSRETRAVQNPALGAMLLWRCSCGYQGQSNVGASIPLPILFLVLPIVLHEETEELLRSTQTQSGLRKFIEKFLLASNGKTDLIMAISRRAQAMRALTLESIQIAVSSNVIAFDGMRGAVFPLSTTSPRVGIPTSVRPLMGSAEKLGVWFAQVSQYELQLLLHVHL